MLESIFQIGPTKNLVEYLDLSKMIWFHVLTYIDHQLPSFEAKETIH